MLQISKNLVIFHSLKELELFLHITDGYKHVYKKSNKTNRFTDFLPEIKTSK